MTVIDRYILHNSKKDDNTLSSDLGVSANFVRCRRAIISDNLKPVYNPDVASQVMALRNLIEARKTGWAVDVAKQLLEKLERESNKNPSVM